MFIDEMMALEDPPPRFLILFISMAKIIILQIQMLDSVDHANQMGDQNKQVVQYRLESIALQSKWQFFGYYPLTH